MKKISTMLAMIAASEAMSNSYNYEYRGSDLLIRNKTKDLPVKGNKRKVYYTVDSPEVKRMSM